MRRVASHQLLAASSTSWADMESLLKEKPETKIPFIETYKERSSTGELQKELAERARRLEAAREAERERRQLKKAWWREMWRCLMGVWMAVVAVCEQLGLCRRGSERRKSMRRAMSEAASYREWFAAARELDYLEGKDQWKQQVEAGEYDWRLIQHRLKTLRGWRERGRGTPREAELVCESMLGLRAGLLRNLGGIGCRSLHSVCHTGTKQLIEEYVQEVCQNLEWIYASPTITLQHKFDFFFETRQSFGRSALLLSGGASLGMYHAGVVRALWENGLLPRVVSGASAGALVAALLGVLRDDEIPTAWEPGALTLEAFERRQGSSWRRRLGRLLNEGVLMDIKILQQCVRDNIGDITFKEAYERTGRIINITVASTDGFETSRLLNYLTAPNVLIWSAACASCALKYLYAPVELMAKDIRGRIRPYHPSGLKWSDGSVQDDLPMRRLSELFNVNHFIVSQTNPHVVPFLPSRPNQPEGRFSSIIRNEIIFRIQQCARLWPSFDFSPVAHQNYIGHITIVPRLSINDFLNVITNPSIDSFQLSILMGQRFTWPQMSYIQNHTQIEQVLEKYTRAVRGQLYPEEHADRTWICASRSLSSLSAQESNENLTCNPRGDGEDNNDIDTYDSSSDHY